MKLLVKDSLGNISSEIVVLYFLFFWWKKSVYAIVRHALLLVLFKVAEWENRDRWNFLQEELGIGGVFFRKEE